MVSDLRREIKTSTLLQKTEQSSVTTIDLLNEMNFKASEFLISVIKKKLSHQMTQEQQSKRRWVNILHWQANLHFVLQLLSPTQHCCISHQLFEMQHVKPPKSCSALQDYKNVLSDTLSRLGTSSNVCIHSAGKKLLVTVVSDRHITRWAERISELVLPQLSKKEKVFCIMLLWI